MICPDSHLNASGMSLALSATCLIVVWKAPQKLVSDPSIISQFFSAAAAGRAAGQRDNAELLDWSICVILQSQNRD